MESDLNLYLDCIQKPISPQSQKDSLFALAELLSSNGELKRVLREKKGLHVLLKILLSSKSPPLPVLYTLSCAVDSCVSSQNVLIQKGTLGLISTMLKQGINSPVFQSAACLLSFLTQGNSLGQNKARHAGIIAILISYLRAMHPVTLENKNYWNSILTCFSSVVNNPRNSLNQETCMEIVPLCLTALQENTAHPDLIQSLASFIRLCLSDNGENQEKFAKMGALKTCVSILEKTASKDLAWATISLVNASPLGLMVSGELQAKCVPVLLKWMRSGESDDMPAGLHTLSMVIEQNNQANTKEKEGLCEEREGYWQHHLKTFEKFGGMNVLDSNRRAALIADKNGMSSIIRCMSVGDENIKKTARLLLQLLFHHKTESTPTESPSDVESDLESASYEIVKQTRKPLKRTTTKQKNDDVKHEVGIDKFINNRSRDSSKSSSSRKRNMVVRGAGSWVVGQRNKRVKTSPEKAESWNGPTKTPARYKPLTPQPTPAIHIRDIDTPYTRKDVKTPFFTTRKEQKTDRRHTLGPFKAPSDALGLGVDTNNIAAVVSKAIDDRMGDFLDRFERVVSTNVSRASSVPSPKSCQMEASDCRSENAARAVRRETKTDNCSTMRTITDKRSEVESKCDAAVQANPDSRHTISTGTCSALFNNMKISSPVRSRTFSTATEDDAGSIATHISQTSLMEGFFSNNPELIPNSYKNPCTSQKEGMMVVPKFDDLERRQQRCSTGEGDSGFGNLSQVSFDEIIGGSGTRTKLFFEKGPQSTNDESESNSTNIKLENFSEQEIANICKGVQMFGKSWSLILARFEFHPTRNTEDLRRKFGQVKKYISESNSSKASWSKVEIRRLQRGFLKYGSDWSRIIKHYEFDKSKTASDLCTQWLQME